MIPHQKSSASNPVQEQKEDLWAATMHLSAGVERAAGLRGQVSREPGQSLTAAAISVVIYAVDVLVALSASSLLLSAINI